MNHPKRPAAVTWLAIVVFVLAMVNLLGVYGGLARRSMLAALKLALPLWGVIALAGVWSIAWLVLAWGLWHLHHGARLATVVAFPLYELTLIGQQAFFAQGGYERGRLPFVIGAAALATGIVIFVLTRPGVRRAFDRPCHSDKEPEEL